jgi:hypothetical protein
MRGQGTRISQEGARSARRAGTAGLLLVVLLGLAVGLCPTGAGAARRDRAAGAAVPSAAALWHRAPYPPYRRFGESIQRVAFLLHCTRKAYGWRAESTFSAVMGKSWMRTPTAS